MTTLRNAQEGQNAGMRTQTAVMGVSAVIAVAGAATMAVAWAVGSVGWLLADLPDADNDLLREITLAAIGSAFVILGLVGAVVGRLARATGQTSSGAVVAAGVLAVGSLLVAVAGAGLFAAHAAALAVSPVLDEAELLNVPGSDGRVVLLVALVLGVAALGVLLGASRSPAPVDQEEHVASSQ